MKRIALALLVGIVSLAALSVWQDHVIEQQKQLIRVLFDDVNAKDCAGPTHNNLARR